MFSQEQEAIIVAEIRAAEIHTSGEIRVYVEDYCFKDSPLARAAEIFHLSKMTETVNRNGVLIYIAEHSRQYAIYGDQGVFHKEPPEFWLSEKVGLREHFRKGQFAEGVIHLIQVVGDMLSKHFPDTDNKRNELPDEIIYG
jgi:uncharacterized membrane protein